MTATAMRPGPLGVGTPELGANLGPMPVTWKEIRMSDESSVGTGREGDLVGLNWALSGAGTGRDDR